MKRIGDLDVESFYNTIDFWGKRITDRLERIETTKESIWAIHSKWRGWFYWILSFFGVVSSSFMVYMEWGKSWFEVFGVLWNSILGSVVIVWFLFQLGESLMGAYTIALDWVEKRKQERNEQFKKIRRQEYREQSRRLIEFARQKVGNNASAEEAFQAMESACSSSQDDK